MSALDCTILFIDHQPGGVEKKMIFMFGLQWDKQDVEWCSHHHSVCRNLTKIAHA